MIRTLLTLAAVLGTASSLRAQEEVCVPKFAGTAAPALTATVTDASWAGALRFNLKETAVGTLPDWAAVARAGWQRGVSAAVDGLYLSLVVKQSMIPPADNVRVILGIRTAGAEDWVIHVDPFDASPPTSGGGSEAPQAVPHWRHNGSSWVVGPTGSATDWLLAARVAVDNPTWSLTLRIPFNAVPANPYPAGAAFPSDDKFSFYLDIVPATTLSSSTNQIPWPQGLNMPTAAVTAANTPAASSWSSAGLLPGDDVFIPGIGGLAALPVIDGKVEGDGGWNRALRVNLAKDLGVSRSAVLQAGRAGNFLYLGVVVKADSAPDAADTLLLCLSPETGGAARDWRFHIRPFSGVPATDVSAAPAQALFWRDSAAWNNLPTPAGTDALAGLLSGNISTYYDGTEWSVEMKIPLSSNAADVALNTAVYLPTAATFKLQLDVLATSSVTTTVTQMAWPLCAEVMPYSNAADTNLLENNTPSPALWGVASFYDRPECNGISLTWDRIGVRDPAGTSIVSVIRRYNPIAEANLAAAQALSPTVNWPATHGERNLFVAEPYNGTAAAARVQATFRMADWGLPVAEQWTPIKHDTGVTQTTPMELFENPTPATLSATPNVPATSFGTLEMNWYLSYRESAVRKFLNQSTWDPNRSHQCIQVDLDSPDTSVRFKNKSVQRNMDFVGASVFKADAKISGKGRGPLTAGRAHHQVLLAVKTRVRPHGEPAPEKEQRRQPRKVVHEDQKERVLPPEEGEPDELVKYPEAVKETFTWIARGYRLTGRSIRIHAADYEVADFLGGFGVVAGHEGPVETWTHEIEHAASRRKADGLYLVDVPHDQAISLTLRLEAVPKKVGLPDWAVWLFVLLLLLVLFLIWWFLRKKR